MPICYFFKNAIKKPKRQKRLGFSGGRGWIRTIEAKQQQIYSLPPLATRELSHIKFKLAVLIEGVLGAGGRTRTPDLLITNQLLYQLSYTSSAATIGILAQASKNVKCFFEFLLKFFFCLKSTISTFMQSALTSLTAQNKKRHRAPSPMPPIRLT